MRLSLVIAGIVALGLVAGTPAPPGVPTAIQSCVESRVSSSWLDASASDSTAQYFLVGVRDANGESGGQDVIVLKNNVCRRIGADTVAFPLSRWGVPAKIVSALAQSAVVTEISRTPGGVSSLKKEFAANPAVIQSLAPEQLAAYRAAGVLP